MNEAIQHAPDPLAGLAVLAANADGDAHAIDNPAPAAQPGAELVPAGPDYMGEAAGAVDMFSALVCGWAPAAGDIWTDKTKARVAGALAPVMEKYGFTFGSMPPEVTLLIIAGPPLWQSSRLIAAQIAKDKAEAAIAKAKAKDGAQDVTSRPAGPATAPAQAVHEQVALYPS